ncbi:hypothetical protein [Qipengyuania atrilutea]|uniref:Abortive infection protein-like C-terminal domain-containing protein n=1 Tax=Qipengyuania atrilutea TaxID=2744473 RepID=A0A850H640_9SPHN|nr:hypothetical protein [Actirhodobacter atriluteus]NVD46136.1 hypothetical protein [Actirhodobacter atriluteus]
MNSEFNRMTIVAAAEVVAEFKSHSEMEILEVQWGIADEVSASGKAGRVACWAKVALARTEPQFQGGSRNKVLTENGLMTLERAMVETAIKAPPMTRDKEAWKKLIAGLRLDGFEVVEDGDGAGDGFSFSSRRKSLRIIRMLPEAIPGLDIREAENEVMALLNAHGFLVAKGHLSRAMSAFQRGEWSGANGELRNFFESYLNEIADRLGSQETDSKMKRDFLGGVVSPAFLLAEYNEWHENNQKPQFVQGLMSRMHPHGGHPGLSEEEDATFRIQITLITARLFLRRFDQRK